MFPRPLTYSRSSPAVSKILPKRALAVTTINFAAALDGGVRFIECAPDHNRSRNARLRPDARGTEAYTVKSRACG